MFTRTPYLRIVPTLAALLLLASAASAQTASTTFGVSASVVRACTISAANLGFGSYDPLSATPVDAQNTLTVACTKNTVATIGLDYGQNGSGTTRQMAFGAERLPYTLWRDAARSLTWGNAAPNLYTYTSAGRAAAAVIVYGQIPVGTDVPAGAYADQVVATINF